jgi:PBSX family phage terminase large subunit
MLQLSQKQKDFYKNSNARYNVAHGAVRSGKTFIMNLRWLRYIKEAPPGPLLMSGRTKDSLKENVLKPIFEIIGPANYQYKEQTGELIIFGRHIKCVGADKADAETKIRGQTYAGWYGDEITIQHKAFVLQAIARCSVPDSLIFWTTNPDHPKHYIKTDFLDNQPLMDMGDLKMWHFLMDDNATLSPKYVASMKSTYSGVFYKRNIEGLWVVADGLVYQDYQPRHRVSAATIQQMIASNQFKTFIAGTDWGYTHPMVGLIIGITHDNRYYLIHEFYKTQERTESLVDWYKAKALTLPLPIEAIFCDSAEPDRIITMRAGNLPATNANKSIREGINAVMTLFKNDRLFISDACVNTDKELQMYSYPDGDSNTNDLPMDKDNHALDAGRYALFAYEKYLMTQTHKEDRRRKNRRSII